MPTHVLLATDFSEASEEAARQAHAIAAHDGAALGVCHVVPEGLPADGQVPPWLAAQIPDRGTLEQRAKDALEQLVGRLGGEAKNVELFVEEGDAATAVVRRAEAFGADLVVVGSHGRTGIKRVLLGSVAEKIVRHAPCAVLVAREGPESGPVVTATDFSDAARPGLRAAALEAARTGSALHAVHVIDTTWLGLPLPADTAGLWAAMESSDFRKEIRAALDKELAEATSGLGVEARGELLLGDAGRQIVQRAEELGARLVVISTHGRTGISRALLGSVAERVVRLAHASVMAVRAKEANAGSGAAKAA
jgi:nucleotide-binding universal stress UspA family protein